jgi:predicted RNA binding protein YcfA (HicA-like mRNA interferase family)
MPQIGPIRRQDLINSLRKLGFSGPFAGGKHEYMKRAGRRVVIPNPHGRDISAAFLRRILTQAGVTVQEWESV